MAYHRHLVLQIAAVAVLTSGCATAGTGGTDSVSNTVYATHRLVQNLDQNISGTVSRLNDTTAQLVTQLESSEYEMRQLMSVAQENQYKLEMLQRSLDSLTATLYRHLNLSPPDPVTMPAPTRPFPPTPEIDRGGIVVEPPTVAPQPDTGVSGVLPPPSTFTPDPFDPLPDVTPSFDEDAHYRTAQQLYGGDDFNGALQQFTEHLAQFPNSKHAPNATYWKAHCYFKMGSYAEAIEGFDDLRSNFPDSGKVPIAMHNQAVAYSRLGQNQRAIELFQRLIREYPDDVATEGARDKLRQLQNLN